MIAALALHKIPGKNTDQEIGKKTLVQAAKFTWEGGICVRFIIVI